MTTIVYVIPNRAGLDLNELTDANLRLEIKMIDYGNYWPVLCVFLWRRRNLKKSTLKIYFKILVQLFRSLTGRYNGFVIN